MEQPSSLAALVSAITAGELAAVQRLVAAQPSLVNQRIANDDTTDVMTPLLLAVEQGLRQRVGESAARRAERAAVLEAVTGAPGADQAATNAAGQTILHFVAERLRYSARTDQLELAGRLLRQAAGVPLDAAAGAAGRRWAPLHTAAACCSPFGGLLVEAGADVNRLDAQGRSALHLAAKHAHWQLAQLLLDDERTHVPANLLQVAIAGAEEDPLDCAINRKAKFTERRHTLLEVLPAHPRIDAAALDSLGRHFLFYWAASAPLSYPPHFYYLRRRAAQLGLGVNHQDSEGNGLLHVLACSVAAVPPNCPVTFNALSLLQELLQLGINAQSRNAAGQLASEAVPAAAQQHNRKFWNELQWAEQWGPRVTATMRYQAREAKKAAAEADGTTLRAAGRSGQPQPRQQLQLLRQRQQQQQQREQQDARQQQQQPAKQAAPQAGAEPPAARQRVSAQLPAPPPPQRQQPSAQQQRQQPSEQPVAQERPPPKAASLAEQRPVGAKVQLPAATRATSTAVEAAVPQAAQPPAAIALQRQQGAALPQRPPPPAQPLPPLLPPPPAGEQQRRAEQQRQHTQAEQPARPKEPLCQAEGQLHQQGAEQQQVQQQGVVQQPQPQGPERQWQLQGMEQQQAQQQAGLPPQQAALPQPQAELLQQEAELPQQEAELLQQEAELQALLDQCVAAGHLSEGDMHRYRFAFRRKLPPAERLLDLRAMQAAAATRDWVEASDCVVTSLREQRARLG